MAGATSNSRRNSEELRTPAGSNGRQIRRVGLALLLLAIAAVGGIKTGAWIGERREKAEEARRLDEYLGLGTRTGLTGDLAMDVHPTNLMVRSGEPVKVRLALTNKGSRTKVLNGWLTPSPAEYRSNQFPIQVKISRSGQRVKYTGSAVLRLYHARKDFFRLPPGDSRQIEIDLSKGTGNGRWNMIAPGSYTVELWYETYLTGRYIGVDAWTGMTNHVVVQVTVVPPSMGH